MIEEQPSRDVSQMVQNTVLPQRHKNQYMLWILIVAVICIVGVILWQNRSVLKSPSPRLYLSYLTETKSTPDEIVTANCGNITIVTSHTDEAYEGQKMPWSVGGDTPPRIFQHYAFAAAVDGEKVIVVEDYASIMNAPISMASASSIRDVLAVYVIDPAGFANLPRMRAMTAADDLSAAITIRSSVASEEVVRAVAVCYAQNKDSLDVPLLRPISGFVYTAERTLPGSPYETFTCEGDQSVVIDGGNYLRLNGETSNIIGILGVDGSFSSWMNDYRLHEQNKVPARERNIESWASCKDKNGVALVSYVENLKLGVTLIP